MRANYRLEIGSFAEDNSQTLTAYMVDRSVSNPVERTIAAKKQPVQSS